MHSLLLPILASVSFSGNWVQLIIAAAVVAVVVIGINAIPGIPQWAKNMGWVVVIAVVLIIVVKFLISLS